MPGPIAYIRRSSASEDSPGDVSRSAQETAIAQLAHRDGHNGDVTYFVDWARSADEDKLSRRSAYADMIRAIEAGEVTTLYAYSLDRLHRSVIQTSKLVKAAEDRGVRIVTQREGEVRQDTPAEWLRFTTLATFGEYELKVAKRRAADATATRKARGDYMGRPPYGFRVRGGRLEPNPAEDVQAVLDAYQAAGSFLGAAKALNAAGVTPPRRSAAWHDSSVARVVRRNLRLPRTAQGVKQRADHLLYRLLVCPHCSAVLTPVRRRGRPGDEKQYTTYVCYAALRNPNHPRPYSVSELKVIPWLRAEAARVSPPDDAVQVVQQHAERAEALRAERERLGWALVKGVVTDVEAVQTQQAAIDAELERLEASASVVTILPDMAADETWEPEHRAALNDVLRSLFAYIELDAAMQPTRAEWLVPEWRR